METGRLHADRPDRQCARPGMAGDGQGERFGKDLLLCGEGGLNFIPPAVEQLA